MAVIKECYHKPKPYNLKMSHAGTFSLLHSCRPIDFIRILQFHNSLPRPMSVIYLKKCNLNITLKCNKIDHKVYACR